MRQVVRFGRGVLPLLLGWLVTRRRTRLVGLGSLLALWTAVHARYRRRGHAYTARELELMATATPEAYSRHYNERVPTTVEELDMWGSYHAHRHRMRYRIVADRAGAALPDGGTLVDIGCGGAMVADLLRDRDMAYVGLDFGGHHIGEAMSRHGAGTGRQRTRWVRGSALELPFADAVADVVVWTEVIEHLVRPELAVWEVARILKPGGVLVLTTNNASEMPLHPPTTHLGPWLEKAIGFRHDRLISHRPWVWPEAVDPDLLPPGSDPVYLPHTWHAQAETRRMFAAAGLDTEHASTFEFPPPQSRTARWLQSRGAAGERAVDVVEAVATRTPLVRRLGCHVLMVARRRPGPLPARPPGIWPGPFSRD